MEKYKKVRFLAAGFHGSVDLVKSLVDGKYYVMKKQKLLPEEVVEVKTGGKITYRLKKDTKMYNEMLFFKTINKMKPSEQKYFTKLKAMKIYHGNDCNYEDESMHKRKSFGVDSKEFRDLDSSHYCIYYVIEYAGKSLSDYILSFKTDNFKDWDYKEAKNITLQMLIIYKILRKYGFLYFDGHTDNFCYNDKKLKMIDYGTMESLASKIKKQPSINKNMAYALDVWKISLFHFNDITSDTRRGLMINMNDEFLIRHFKAMYKSREIGRILRGLKVYIRPLAAERIAVIMNMFKTLPNDINEMRRYGNIMNSYFLLYDPVGYKRFWDPGNKLNVPQLLKPSDYKYLMNNIHDISKLIMYFRA